MAESGLCLSFSLRLRVFRAPVHLYISLSTSLAQSSVSLRLTLHLYRAITVYGPSPASHRRLPAVLLSRPRDRARLLTALCSSACLSCAVSASHFFTVPVHVVLFFCFFLCLCPNRTFRGGGGGGGGSFARANSYRGGVGGQGGRGGFEQGRSVGGQAGGEAGGSFECTEKFARYGSGTGGGGRFGPGGGGSGSGYQQHQQHRFTDRSSSSYSHGGGGKRRPRWWKRRTRRIRQYEDH